ncbi:uncharacterized protein LOC135930969 isoform X3 [Gordionus sp. m RMFG-2023]|uniref:uncharacterized protein LOC135930969 isoform X3 n=1 Tax=Gordionus sp. m RMFG-2023 TaxID=3053472 RepID=UPI0031FC0999
MSNYEKNTFSNYYISRSKPHHDPIYKYKTLTYNCKRGGRIFKSSSTGLREKRTFKQGCNSKICVRKILYDNEIPKISQNLPTIAASSCIAETINTGDSFPIAETNILVNTGDSSPIAETSQILVNTGDSSPIAETSQILDNTGDSFPIAETSQILEVISDSSCIPRISNFSQANQNMTETINLPASNTENTQLCAIKLSSSQIISKNILGTQVKIPETTNLYSQYHFQNIPKNLGPMSRTIPDSTQVKIPETTNLYLQYHFQNIPKNLGPQSKTIPATVKLSSSQIISKNMLGTQVKIPESKHFTQQKNSNKLIFPISFSKYTKKFRPSVKNYSSYIRILFISKYFKKYLRHSN